MSDVVSAAYLEVLIDGERRQFPLAGDTLFRIGRSENNNVVIDDDVASRHHAMLQRSEGGFFYITDLSTNGTLVNGARISVPVLLQPGDLITIGSHEFSFFQDTSVTAAGEATSGLQATNIFFAQKLITVLVADIRDFTGLARRIEPNKLSQLTGTLFRQTGKELQECGAWAQKYIGDAVMAVWLHKNREAEPGELLPVFESLSKLAAIAAGLQDHFDLDAPVSFGTGINTGWASVGNVGSLASSDYTAMGDVVNKAFRLESATRELGCDLALGQETYNLLASSIGAARLFGECSVTLKGYDEPATVYTAPMTCLSPVLAGLKEIGLAAAARQGRK